MIVNDDGDAAASPFLFVNLLGISGHLVVWEDYLIM